MEDTMKIQLNNISKSYAGDLVLDELSLEIIKGSKSAIVGENGSGKSTLLKILSGIETFQSGSLAVPKEMSIGYMMQVFPNTTVSSKDFILDAFEDFCFLNNKLRELEKEMSQSDDYDSILDEYSKALDRFNHIGGYEFEDTLEAYAKGLGVFDILDQPFNTLSGGQKTRIALVRLLLQDNEVICLDEPTNHLDLDGILWLENFVNGSNKTIIIVSHDREFLSNTVNVYYELEDGQVVTYYGTYDNYRRERHERYLRLVNDFEQQQKEISKIKLAIRRYRQWGHEADNEAFFKKAKTLEKKLEKMNQLPKPIEIRNQLEFKLDNSKLGSKIVVDAKDLCIGYDQALNKSLDFTIQRGERYAIVAPNGKGKTTLIKTLMKEIPPLSGSIEFGPTVDIGYLPQIIHYDNDKERILDHIKKSCSLDEETARRSLARFGFYKADMFKYLSHLSGGEQVRLKLLEMMMRDCNCIILDEPTNHLDIASCEIIEEVLGQFEGTIIVISHDRMFLEAINAKQLRIDYNK